MKTILLIAFSFVLSTAFFGQKDLYLHLQPKFNGQPLALMTDYPAWNNRLIKLDHFDYYISDFTLVHDGGQTISLPNHIFLVEPDQTTFYLGNFPVEQLESIRFFVGVPKVYNVQNGSLAQDISLYPANHPLSFQSPTMYWGWQFGYMHMIIGGWGENENQGTADNYFELHNLGNSNQEEISVNVVASAFGTVQRDIFLNCHVDRWIRNIDFQTIGVAHGEIGVNKTILQNAVNQTVFTADELASLPNNPAFATKFSVHNKQLTIQTPQSPFNFVLRDLQGKEVFSKTLYDHTHQLSVEHLSTGIYHLQFTENATPHSLKIFIP
jgi:hypothetical protein